VWATERVGRLADVQIVVANNKTTIIADAGSKEEIQARVAQIKRELEGSDSIYDQQKLSERIAKLSGGVAIIKVRPPPTADLASRAWSGAAEHGPLYQARHAKTRGV
jgi:chaperonin GroEL (HSP60 family)